MQLHCCWMFIEMLPVMISYHVYSLKVDSHHPIVFCFNDSPSKVMKNTFYFILKALFIP